MAQRNKAAFAGLYGSSGTLFADNSTRQISEADLRALGEDIKDSALYIEDLYKTYGVTASGTDTYTATPNPAITAYAADTVFIIKFTNANTGAATLNLAGLGAKAIVKNAATALSAGDINAGQILALVYDGTNFQIVGGGGGGGGAVSSVNGETGDVVVKQSRVAVVQVSHGFSVGDVLTRISSTTQTIDDTTTQTPIGMVVQVVDADNYILASDGYVSGLSGLTSGTLYYVQNDGSLGTTRTPLPYFLANSSSTGWIIKPNVLSHLQYNRVITTDAQSILQSDNGGKIY
ncbi:MAG: hypothetical protein VKL39_02855, partial [Leptolyngbyaceae bacterium]|nr:hypothetical protein [Leptolyngbyaceae bacterium]